MQRRNILKAGVAGSVIAGAPMVLRAQQAYKAEYKMSTVVGPAFAWGKGAEIFANIVRERTGGRINIKQYPGSSLVQGQQDREFSAMRQGVIDVLCGAPINWAGTVRELGVFSELLPHHVGAAEVARTVATGGSSPRSFGVPVAIRVPSSAVSASVKAFRAWCDGGPWDAARYPGPYWEDNDLCLRALAAGVALVQTAWPVQHKGGRTAGSLARHAASFAANEHTFTDSVLALLPRITPLAIPTTPVQHAYMTACATASDIQHHLPLLFALARGNVLELGTRSGVSTAALLAGVEGRGGHVYSVDIDPRSAHVAAGHPQWTFRAGSSTDPQTAAQVYRNAGGSFQAVLVDTLHTDAQVSAELNLWAPYVAPGGTICVHDPETFPGVRVAVERFCAAQGWPVTFVLPCNGMAVIEVPKTP